MTERSKTLTEEKRQKIAEFWNAGMTSSKIAELVGVTRNSVIGAVHRLRQKGFIMIDAAQKTKYKPRTKKPLPIRRNMKKPIELGTPVGILKLTHRSCRFIVEEGDVVSTKYCNNEIERGAYCSYHYKLCYIPPRRQYD